MTDPQDDKGECPHCDYYKDSHTDEQRDDCDLKDALEEMPKEGLRFLVYLSLDAMDSIKDFGRWSWTDLDGISSSGVMFVRMAVKDGEILEDLG